MLKDVEGQSRAIAQLQAALRHRRVHHAWLFAGPPGVGKEAAARAFAAALLCREEGEDACGRCAACQKVARGVHPDLVVLLPEAEAVARKLVAREDLPRTPSRELKIEQIRRMEPQLRHAPLEGPRRVVLLLRADSLNVPAQNAFLKTLEEPPPGTHLVLVADAGDALLPTIRSRCVRVPFAPLALDVVAARVAAGLPDRARILESLEALDPADLRPLLALAEELAGGGRENGELRLELIALFYRDVALAAEGVDEARLANRDLAPLVHAAAGRGADEALRRVRLAERARAALQRHANARLAAEQMLLSMVLPEVER